MLSGTMTLPALTQAQADSWISFLMQLRGMANAFQIGDPFQPLPRGSGSGAPMVDNTVAGGNPPGSETLGTKGWTPNAQGVLLQGDWIQVGYRLYRALDNVNADGSGKALIPIWPTLRETPTSNGSSAGWLNATGSLDYLISRSTGITQFATLWSNFSLAPSVALPADAIIQGIYPVIDASGTFSQVTDLGLAYGTGMNISGLPGSGTSPFTSPSNPNNTSFSATQFVGSSIGTSLSAMNAQQIMAYLACSLNIPTPTASTPTMTDQIAVTAVGYAIYYTSATPTLDAQMTPPFTLPFGQGVAWGLPFSLAQTGISVGSGAIFSPSTGEGIGEPVLYNGGIIVNNPQGLFRLASNKRTSSVDFTRLSKLSFPFQEYR
jgi:hypothetical protein